MPRRHSLFILVAGAALAAASTRADAQGKSGQSSSTPAKSKTHFVFSMLAGGQTLDLGPVAIVNGPRDMLTGVALAGEGKGAKHAVATQPENAAAPQPVLLDVPIDNEATTKRLNDAHQCVVDGHGDGCRFEATLSEIDTSGAVSRSFVARGAWVSTFEMPSAKSKSPVRAMRLTLAYQTLALAAPSPQLPPPSGSVATSGVSNGSLAAASAPVDSTAKAAPKKKKGFGRFVGGLIKDHGLQAVEMATGVGEAAMVMHSLKLAGGGGALGAGSQGQFATLAQQIVTTPGMHQIDAGLPPGARAGAPVDPAAAQAYANAVRAQLIAQGADPSRFTVSVAGIAGSAMTAGMMSAMTKAYAPGAAAYAPGVPGAPQPAGASVQQQAVPGDSAKPSKKGTPPQPGVVARSPATP